MKIVLATAPLDRSVLYGEWDLSEVDSVSPPWGLLQLAAVVRELGHEVAVVDAYANEMNTETAVADILMRHPDVVGLSAMTPSFPSASRLATALKEREKDLPIILGGAHVSAASEEALRGHPEFDAAVLAEGEDTLPDVLNALRGKRPLSSIPGIAFRNGECVVRTPPRPFIEDMDRLPLPAWDLLPSISKPYRLSVVGTTSDLSTSLLTSRGCPARCTFCDTGAVGRKIRGYSAGYVILMIEHLIERYGIRDFVIYDDTFVALKRRTFEICNEIIRRGWNISWSCCARVDCVTPDMLSRMREAGCWQIEYGIESGSQRMVEFMKKKINLSRVEEVLRWTHEAGIQTRGNFILGYLTETKETLEETLRFALQIDLDYLQASFLTPYPGSEIFAIAHRYGEFDRTLDRMNNLTINFVPEGMTREELRKFSRRLFLRFYLRPRVIARHILRFRTRSGMRRLWKAFRAFVKTIRVPRTSFSATRG